MAAQDNQNFEGQFFTWLKTFLKDKGLQFSRCGFKTGDGLGERHEFDLAAGYWKEPNYSANKPPHWIYRIVLGSRLIDRQSQNRTVAASATAERKVFAHLS